MHQTHTRQNLLTSLWVCVSEEILFITMSRHFLWLISYLASFFFVSVSWLFPFGCLCCLVFLLVRCQTCVRLDEASRCREVRGSQPVWWMRCCVTMKCQIQVNHWGVSSLSPGGLWTPGGPWASCRGSVNRCTATLGSFWGVFEAMAAFMWLTIQ